MSVEGDSKITLRSAGAAAAWLVAAAGALALFVWCTSGLPDMVSKGNRKVVPYEALRLGGGIAAFAAAFVLIAQAARTALAPKPHDRP